MMNSDPLWQLRSNCRTAIQQCAEAEKTLEQTKRSIAENRKAAISFLQNQNAQMLQQSENVLVEIRKILRQADLLLIDVNLRCTTVIPAKYPSGNSLDELIASLIDQRRQANKIFSQLRDSTEALKKAQKRKWWQFWKLWEKY